VTLQDELDLARRYLNIEKLRLGERLQLRWKINELPSDALVPQLTLQPLLENAIYHGIEPSIAGGVIGIDGHVYGEAIYLTVSNPLPPAGNSIERKGHSIAQENVRQRLAAIYGHNGELKIHRDAENYHLTIIFPYWRERP
jgi:two-component system sensor histidine kinase AlgZ